MSLAPSRNLALQALYEEEKQLDELHSASGRSIATFLNEAITLEKKQ